MHMQKLIAIHSKESGDPSAQIFRGTDHKRIAFFGDPRDGMQSFQVSQEPVVTGFHFDLHRIMSPGGNLAAQLRDPSAGDQASIHEDPDPVTDLLDLIELMAGDKDCLPVLHAQLFDQFQEFSHSFRVVRASAHP